MSRKSKKVFVFSDTHFFSRTSKFFPEDKAEFRNRLMEQIAKADVIIMNGDIFDLTFPENIDMFATREEAIKHASEEAIKWLKKLCKSCPGKEIYFNLGNHENIKKFWDDVQELEQKFDGDDDKCRFTAKKHFLKLGSNLFFHGDLELAEIPLEKREVPKVKTIGTATVLERANFHLEKFVQSVMNKKNTVTKVCRRVLDQLAGNESLDEKHPHVFSWCKKIFFGHTHIPVSKHVDPAYPNTECYNTGSGTNHGEDCFLTGTLEVKENGEYGNMVNIQRLSMFGEKVTSRAA